MKNNKRTVFFITSIITFVIIANYFVEPVGRDEVGPEDKERVTKLKQELNQLHIDYLNLESENRILEERNEELEYALFESRFELNRLNLNSEQIVDFLPYPDSTEILYKDIGEMEYVILYKDEVGTNLVVSSKEEGYIKSLSIGSLDPVEGINWYGGTDPDHYSLGGVIRNSDIETVQVIVNDQMHETNTIKINDDMSVWYCIFEYETKSTLEEPDKMKIEAFDERGVILWEEAFDSDLGG